MVLGHVKLIKEKNNASKERKQPVSKANAVSATLCLISFKEL